MKFTKSDFKTLLIVIAAVIIVGLALKYGDDMPVLEQVREGYSG